MRHVWQILRRQDVARTLMPVHVTVSQDSFAALSYEKRYHCEKYDAGKTCFSRLLGDWSLRKMHLGR